MDLWLWGDCEFNISFNMATIKRFNSKIIYKVFLYDNNYLVQVISETNIILFEFIDKTTTYIGTCPDLNTFERTYKNNRYNYKDGKLIGKTINKKTNFIKPLKYNIITMDLECFKFVNKLIPICISIFDGERVWSLFKTDYKNVDLMLQSGIKSVMKKKYNGYLIFFHNLSYFDGIFIFKILTNLSNKIEPIFRDNQMIEIKFYFGYNNKYYLIFRDSFNILPASLKKIS